MADRPAKKIFRGMLLLLAVAAACWFALGFVTGFFTEERPPKPRPRLGINLAGPCDWNTELPFVDLMRFSRPWSSQQKGLPFGKGPPLEIEGGYPKRLPEGTWAESPLLSFNGHPIPAGNYTVLYAGNGTVSLGAATKKIISQSPGRMVVRLESADGTLHLSIQATDPDDPVRDIHVIMPGFEESWRKNPWQPDFIERWHGVACFRFMDFMATNNSAIRTWDERPRVEDATYAARGVPLELLIDLCNRQKADAWFCIPHMATDDYVRNFARMVFKRLDPSLKAHIEYSNEVWNTGFQQYKYAGVKGQELGLAKEPWVAAWRFTSKRSVEIFRIFEEVFGSRSRLVRILPAQSGNLFMAREILDFEKASQQADAVAIAPYVGLNVSETADRYTPMTAGIVAHWDVAKVIDHLRFQSLPETVESIRAYRSLATSHGLDLIAYEGGQHLVGIHGAENNAAVTALFQAANADPGMGAIYGRLFNAWTQDGGSLFCHFSSVAKWTKWGSWGAFQYFDDDPSDSPKFCALMRWARARGQAVGGLSAEEIREVPVRKNVDPGQ